MFYDFIYTNKNTNNTQKYPVFLLCRCPNHIRRVMSIKWENINMMLWHYPLSWVTITMFMMIDHARSSPILARSRLCLDIAFTVVLVCCVFSPCIPPMVRSAQTGAHRNDCFFRCAPNYFWRLRLHKLRMRLRLKLVSKSLVSSTVSMKRLVFSGEQGVGERTSEHRKASIKWLPKFGYQWSYQRNALF